MCGASVVITFAGIECDCDGEIGADMYMYVCISVARALLLIFMLVCSYD